jgi:hypothetical protein
VELSSQSGSQAVRHVLDNGPCGITRVFVLTDLNIVVLKIYTHSVEQ